MTEYHAQGDVLLERVADIGVSGTIAKPDDDGAVVLARGEATGHRHAFYGGNVVMFRDEALARDMPAELYVGHVVVGSGPAELRHEEHSAVTLPAGTYRVRRQREFEPGPSERTRVVAD